MRDGLVRSFVPMLDRERLVEDPDGGLFHEDGTPVDPERVHDVVYVNADEAERRMRAGATGWWRAMDDAGPKSLDGDAVAGEVRVGEVLFTPRDVSEMLVAVASAHEPAGPVDVVDAGFFHRTLVRWMGLDDEDSPVIAPRWDYRFWKAELHLEGRLDRTTHAISDADDDADGTATVKAWTAEVWRGEDAGPERYRYWVAFDEEGRIEESAWLSAPPDLLADDAEDDGAGFHSSEPDLDVIERALAEE